MGMNVEEAKGMCALCMNPIESTQDVVLVGGERVHRTCYDREVGKSDD